MASISFQRGPRRPIRPSKVIKGKLPDGQEVLVEIYKAKWQGETDKAIVKYIKWADGRS